MISHKIVTTSSVTSSPSGLRTFDGALQFQLTYNGEGYVGNQIYFILATAKGGK